MALIFLPMDPISIEYSLYICCILSESAKAYITEYNISLRRFPKFVKPSRGETNLRREFKNNFFNYRLAYIKPSETATVVGFMLRSVA